MMAANFPAVLLGRQLTRWMSLRTLRWRAVVLALAFDV